MLRRPSPSMVIALVALFVALGGSSYAALRIGSTQVRNNSIKSIDIKNRTLKGTDVARGTITGAHLRNGTVAGLDLAPSTITGDKLAANSVDGSKIVDNAVSGADVDENTLGPVPNATNATNATNAGNAGNADTLDTLDSTAFEPASRTLRLGLVRLVDGETKALGTFGGFTFAGICEHDGAGNDSSILQITSTQDNSAVNADTSDNDFDATQTASFVEVDETAATVAFDSADDATAVAPDGSIVHGLDVFAGLDVLGAECVVGGTLRLG